MDFHRLVSRLFALFIIWGLVTAPLVTPAAARAPSISEMTGMSAMSADMPCCPDKQKRNDCHDCPAVAMCVSPMQAVPAVAGAILMRHPRRAPLVAFDDMISDGLDRPPPDQPPRNLV
jgi:hypothetical protein